MYVVLWGGGGGGEVPKLTTGDHTDLGVGGDVKVDHNVHMRYVQPPTGDIRGNQN